MPRAIPKPRRAQVLELHQRGCATQEIARELNLPPRTVRELCRQFRLRGEAALENGYARCGRSGPRFPADTQQAAVARKRAHPTWGGGLIRLELGAERPAQALPSVRTLQRWFRAAGLQRSRALPPPAPAGRGHAAHAVWQVDAKERLRLADGSGASVLTVTDEASGALLAVVPFPPLPLDAGPGDGGAASVGGALYPLGPAGAHPRG